MSIPVCVGNNLTDSSFDFQRLIWPAIAAWCGGGEYVPVESTAEKQLANDLDFYAGIDGYHKIKIKGVMRGIASRIQWEKYPGQWAKYGPWNTFSIRKSRGTGTATELNKRLYALSHLYDGYIFPHFTVQAYISQRRIGQLLSVAMAYTRQLIPYAYEKWTHCGDCNEVCERKVWEDGKCNTFLAVSWDRYEQTGLFLKRWPDITPDASLWMKELEVAL
jgi:hypothetical protein